MSSLIKAVPIAGKQAEVSPQAQPVAGVSRRHCNRGNSAVDNACCESSLQRSSAGPEQGADGVPGDLQAVLGQPGAVLDPASRGLFEPRFRHDFSRVRIHTDTQAVRSAQSVNAAAYTVGDHIVFGAGQYRPDRVDGQGLLAHELTHVVQQSGLPANGPLRLGDPNDVFEQAADRAAASLGAAVGGGRLQRAVLQRQPAPGLGSLAPFGLNPPKDSLEVSESDSISAENPKLKQLSASYAALRATNPDAYIKLSAELTDAAKLSTAAESAERKVLSQRLLAVRDALQALGVAREQISVQAPTAYSRSAHGQVAVDLYKWRAALPAYTPFPGSLPGLAPLPAPATSGSGLPALSDLLTLKFGPVTVELPKSVAVKLPIRFKSAKQLVIDLKAQVPGSFSFSMTLDGLPYLRIGLKAGASYDKDKGFAGSAGLQVELTETVFQAANPAELKDKIVKAGGDLQKALAEYAAEPDKEKKLMKLPDVASALGDMYDAVDKAKAGCKPVPKAKFEFGYQGPLGGESDPAKKPPEYLGGTLTIPF
ncbi:DUF4157 domain-containing protein [Methylococcaceae bacterium WWC4]|nr:DUF4157 domain-containing protein [Methylococcaceae bacterium WWC4]